MDQLVMTNPCETYRKQGVLTASPIELVVMLYDALRKNMVLAQRAIGKNDPSSAHNSLMKSQAIIVELLNSLDMSYALSEDLADIYDFILRHLQEANMRKDAALIGEALELVEELRSAWKEICEAQRGARLTEDAI
jgi:flagellar protein FliS